MLVRLGYNDGCNTVNDAYQIFPGPRSAMTYRFALDRIDYADFATGRVLHSVPGRMAFPVRLADEIFQRCLALMTDPVKARGIVLYDPVCGSGALLATLASLHGNRIAGVIGSDADPEALRLAERNLALLTPAGMDERIARIEALREQYGKSSHAEALASAQRLRAMLVDPPVDVRVFQADATKEFELRGGIRRVPSRRKTPSLVDVVIADVPYGTRSFWSISTQSSGHDPLWHLLEALRPVLASSSVVAIASDKAQRPRHDAYVRREWFQVGKRRIELLTPRGAG